MFSALCIVLSSVIFSKSDSSVLDLVNAWNRMSLNSLTQSINLAATDREKVLYADKVESVSETSILETDSLDNRSLRWLFLEQVKTEFNWNKKKWSVIEVTKRGEITRFLNYLICYNGNQAVIVEYRFYIDKWIKIQEWKEHLKMKDLLANHDKTKLYSGCNSGDVVVTNFETFHPTKVVYFIEYTLAKDSKVYGIISH
ncbi:hypothetical protein J2T02_004576 [Chitinophaga terrae (ex Kim and Jung 2007)]|uniref:hypothetical protein n=1 Tax=Chitinophaga terrae (ex Kim and Jung 2007) TaxID=408074 RepID=UPI00277E236E|nr:hypothetical protein [Chitinophaga terrae (ex Kim and Jung 2007)]MDQ0109433.1 hypothetical protein [Chitinophaga terrae (ex Kim and Jung 2007)]